MVERHSTSVHTLKKASGVAKMGTIISALAGVAFLYLYIAILEISLQEKVLYAAILTIALAFLFGGLYSILQDSIKAAEREKRRKRFKE
jgi:hypothetical protein